MVEIALSQKQIDRADQFLQSSYTVLNEAGDEYETAKTQLALSQLYLTQNKFEEGQSLLDQCATTFERLQASLDLETVESVRESFAGNNGAIER